jgi:hypothetical protein
LIQALVVSSTVVYPVITVILSLSMATLLLIGILREIPVLMLPSMVIMVCEFCGIVQCKT